MVDNFDFGQKCQLWPKMSISIENVYVGRKCENLGEDVDFDRKCRCWSKMSNLILNGFQADGRKKRRTESGF